MSTSEKWRLAFGFCLLFVLAGLAVMTGIGHVHQEASFGLGELIGALVVMAGGFVNWAFGRPRPAAEAADAAEERALSRELRP